MVLVACMIAFTINWVNSPFQTPEEICWNQFERAIHNDPAFRELTVNYFRGVHWVKGSLNTEQDLDRLISLAEKCGIRDRPLDGPYVHSISITIPGTKRAREYH